jgi:hypothetical protein
MTKIMNFEELAAPMRAAARKNSPAAVLKATTALFKELDRTVVAQTLQVGELAPDFVLPQSGSGRQWSLSETLQKGPVVLSFYRGQW